MKKIWFIILLHFLIFVLSAEIREEIYFKNTDYKLKVYHISGRTPGKTMMIIGGIQGDEPGGYLAADSYVDISLEKGNFIIVPRANLLSIIKNKRIIFKDMNRRFNVNEEAIYEDKVVAVLKKLISESDVLLNLHDGGGFYREVYIDETHNPMKYGQCIIADIDTFYDEDSGITYQLGEIAREVCKKVNLMIKEEEYHFHFNNHNTSSAESMHKEQRYSATYYALTVEKIPAYGVESSKSLPSNELKVYHHNLVINEMMKKFGLIPELPNVYLKKPKLDFLLLNINNERKAIVDGEILRIPFKSSIEILHIEANYERGLIADIVDFGNNNDTNKIYYIDKDTEILVKKDNILAGKIYIKVDKEGLLEVPQIYKGLILEINGKKVVLPTGENLEVMKGSEIIIVSTLPEDFNAIVNFVGFPHPIYDYENDINMLINTGTDLLPRFSPDKGKTYEIYVKKDGKKIASHFIILKKPESEVVILFHNHKEVYLKNGDTLSVNRGDILEIIDVITDIQDKQNIKVNFRGYVTDWTKEGEDRGKRIILNEKLIVKYSINKQGKIYEIVTTYHEQTIGKVKIHILD